MTSHHAKLLKPSNQHLPTDASSIKSPQSTRKRSLSWGAVLAKSGLIASAANDKITLAAPATSSNVTAITPAHVDPGATQGIRDSERFKKLFPAFADDVLKSRDFYMTMRNAQELELGGLQIMSAAHEPSEAVIPHSMHDAHYSMHTPLSGRAESPDSMKLLPTSGTGTSLEQIQGERRNQHHIASVTQATNKFLLMQHDRGEGRQPQFPPKYDDDQQFRTALVVTSSIPKTLLASSKPSHLPPLQVQFKETGSLKADAFENGVVPERPSTHDEYSPESDTLSSDDSNHFYRKNDFYSSGIIGRNDVFDLSPPGSRVRNGNKGSAVV